MRVLLLAAALAVPLIQVSPAASKPDALPMQYGGEWRGGSSGFPEDRGGYRGDRDERREERREMRREMRAERWRAFYQDRMAVHFQREGRAWARLPDFEKERVIRDEWERWGAERWGR